MIFLVIIFLLLLILNGVNKSFENILVKETKHNNEIDINFKYELVLIGFDKINYKMDNQNNKFNLN